MEQSCSAVNLYKEDLTHLLGLTLLTPCLVSIFTDFNAKVPINNKHSSALVEDKMQLYSYKMSPQLTAPALPCVHVPCVTQATLSPNSDLTLSWPSPGVLVIKCTPADCGDWVLLGNLWCYWAQMGPECPHLGLASNNRSLLPLCVTSVLCLHQANCITTLGYKLPPLYSRSNVMYKISKQESSSSQWFITTFSYCVLFFLYTFVKHIL